METPAPQGKEKRRRKPVGRQGRDKQEKVIVQKELEDRIPNLVLLHNRQKEAAREFSDAVKAVAEKSGYLATVVRKVAIANAGDDIEGKRREVTQMAFAFKIDEVQQPPAKKPEKGEDAVKH